MFVLVEVPDGAAVRCNGVLVREVARAASLSGIVDAVVAELKVRIAREDSAPPAPADECYLDGAIDGRDCG